MAKFVGFSKIGQFRNVISDIRHAAQYQGVDADGNPIMDRNVTLPTITFNGTVKLHGTNAGVAQGANGEIWYQSRKNVITPQNDNAGFAFFADSNKDVFVGFFEELRNKTGITDKMIIFGEWCGGNIQKGVAISGLEKMFVIFAVKVAPDGEEESNYYLKKDVWKNLKSVENKIYNINDYEQYPVEIDFNRPDIAQEKMIKIVEQIEKECPVGREFGRKLEEDNTTGEGSVFVGWYGDNRYVFKVKGEKHSVSKVKTLAPVDVEKMNSVHEFVEYSVTENRLEQGIEQVFTSQNKEVDVKFTGDFLRWVVNDIIAEESDTLVKNGLEPKDVNKYISTEARKWYMNYINKQAGL